MSEEVSVIIPCYNVSSTICETLTSLQLQKKAPYEVLCINDGSTDDTCELIRKFAERSPLNIVVLDQKNQGVSAARNNGIKNAKGNILLFLDADDKYSSDFIFEIEKNISDVDTVYGYFSHDEKLLMNHLEIKKISIQEAMRDFMYHKERCHTSAFAYRKDIICKNNLSFTENGKYGEDWEFTTKYLANCHLVALLPGNVMFYRVSDSSAMKKISYSHTDAIFAAERVNQYLEDSGNSFADEFQAYMYDKTVFSVMHIFAQNQRKDLFKRLRCDFDLKSSMKKLMKNHSADIKTRIAAFSYLISPILFYSIVGRM